MPQFQLLTSLCFVLQYRTFAKLNPLFLYQMSDPASLLSSEQGRRRMVKLALTLTENTSLTPSDHERILLDQFVQGKLTIDQLVHLFELKRRG